LLNGGIDVVDVDEQLEPHPVGDGAAVLVIRPADVDDRDLGRAAPQPDIAGFTLGGELEVPGEPEPLVEDSRLRYPPGEDDRKCALWHVRRIPIHGPRYTFSSPRAKASPETVSLIDPLRDSNGLVLSMLWTVPRWRFLFGDLFGVDAGPAAELLPPFERERERGRGRGR